MKLCPTLSGSSLYPIGSAFYVALVTGTSVLRTGGQAYSETILSERGTAPEEYATHVSLGECVDWVLDC